MDKTCRLQSLPNWPRQKHIWIVCFWSVFVIGVIQGLLGGLWLFGLGQTFPKGFGINPFNLTTNRIAWYCFTTGWAVNFAIGFLIAPFGLYAFAYARLGHHIWTKSFAAWLLCHCVLIAVDLWAVGTLWGAVPTTASLSVLIARVGITNVPIWVWLSGIRWVGLKQVQMPG